MTEEIITEKVDLFLEELSETTSMPKDALAEQYKKFHQALVDDPQFQSKDDLERYLINKVRSRNQDRAPAIPRSIIPIGMDQIRKNKDGDRYSSLYVIEAKTKKLRRVAFNGDICDELRNIQLFYPYQNVPLAEYSKTNDFLADTRSDFSNFIDKKIDPMGIIEISGAKKVNLKQILDSDERTLKQDILTRSDDRGWSIATDWRAIHGIVQRISTSDDEKEGTSRGYMSITDSSIAVSKELFDSEGNKIQKNIRVWISPFTSNKITQDSEVWVLGTLSQNPKTKEISMNGFTIIPTFINPLEE